MAKEVKIHVLHCGYIQLEKSMPNAGELKLKNSILHVAAKDCDRVVLPVCAYLVEHPVHGNVLIDTGWCRDISPEGVYDKKACTKLMPGYLADFYRPFVPKGMAIHEQLEAMGIKPHDLDCVIVTHLDPDHVSGVKHLQEAKRIIVPEYEWFYSCRYVFKAHQPFKAFIQYPFEKIPYRATRPDHFWYFGKDISTNHWTINLFGDDSICIVNVPGHTEGIGAVIINTDYGFMPQDFVLLASDAAFNRRSWEEMSISGLGYSEQSMLRSLDWIKSMSALPGCKAVLASHDPEVQPQIITLQMKNLTSENIREQQ